MDKARRKTDKLLNDLERRISEVYLTDPSLLRIEKRYAKYMEYVEDATKADYEAYRKETDTTTKDELKKAYTRRVRELTVRNKQYKDLTKEFARILSVVNQKALDLVNDEMTEIYALNYNQMAVDCRKAGIKVNGK